MDSIADIGISRLIGQGIIDNRALMFQYPHTGTAVIVVTIDIGDFFAQYIRGVQIVNIGLNRIVENHDSVRIRHEHTLIKITEQLKKIELAEIKVFKEKGGYIC